ncbi:MAG: hypothetical protein K2R98_31440 [Gemmataceae bacterium]|nr:hypothetical protein [Gemmataceae bacterium]
MSSVACTLPQRTRIVGFLVFLGAVVVAICTTRSEVGGWNDGSRLATVECLVDHHTLAIDRSVLIDKTCDKLFIDGHYYSDKSPTPALLMAPLYQAWRWLTGCTAAEQLPRFAWAMTLGSSGVAYVIAVCCVFALTRRLRLPALDAGLLTASFALATVAPVYAQHVNNHGLLLGVAAPLVLGLVALAQRSQAGQSSGSLVVGLGALAGLGYTIDLGAGPMLLVCAGALVVYRCRSVGATTLFVAGALPWLVLHHSVNYAVGGTFKPANAVPAYFLWPGCPFGAQNMTGSWHHPSIGKFVLYAFDLLIGKRGFLGHNLPLFLAAPGLLLLLKQRPKELPELLFAACWSGMTWLTYALTSNNLSGLCCSIRWFVPLLAPGWLVLAVLLRDHPRYRPDFLILSTGGLMLTALMALDGPWTLHMVPGFWFIYAATMLCWLGYRLSTSNQVRSARMAGVEAFWYRCGVALRVRQSR